MCDFTFLTTPIFISRQPELIDLRSVILTTPLMTDPLPIVKKKLVEFFWDYVKYGRWSEYREYYIPFEYKPIIV